MNKFFKGILIFVSLPGLIVLNSCGKNNNPDSKKQTKDAPPAIEGYIVKPQVISNEIEVSGTLLPSEETVLMPEIAGRIIQLNLPEGTHVNKGTLLAKLFDSDLQAQLSKLQIQLKTAQATADRQKELLQINGISQQEYDLTVLQVNSINADIANLNAQISKTEIRAPFEGTIGLRKVSEGAFVTPGTPLATIRADQQLKLDFNVPEAYASEIKKGMPLTFSVSGDTTVFNATVLATEQSVDAGALNFSVRAIIKEHDPHLLPGASANVKLTLGSSDHALLVPTRSVIPQARYNNVIVARNGKAELVKVQTGLRRPADIQITSGIKEGDTVVTTGIQFIRPGNILKFSSVK